jgi:hypothetical protein
MGRVLFFFIEDDVGDDGDAGDSVSYCFVADITS